MRHSRVSSRAAYEPLPECANETSCPLGGDGFHTYEDALYTMMIEAAGQSVPDLLIPSYTTFRAYGVMWLAIYVLQNFVLLNVVLATVFSACAPPTT